MLQEKSVAELKEQAKGLGIKGFQQMSKAKLISEIESLYPKSGPDDEKSVAESGQKSEHNEIKLNDDLQSHPKFAKFKKGAN